MDNIRGAKLETGILSVVVPLIDGVLSPYATDTSAPLFGFSRIVQHLSDIFVAERKQAYHETASVAH